MSPATHRVARLEALRARSLDRRARLALRKNFARLSVLGSSRGGREGGGHGGAGLR